MAPLHWKIGFEIELLAPEGSDRYQLAHHIATHFGGQIRYFFHPDAEPSKVPGQKVFYNLTPAFEVVDREGQTIAKVLDDITLQQDLERSAAPVPGWYRLLSDDPRLLRLVARHSSPNRPLAESLDQVAALFGTSPEQNEEGIVRLCDAAGAAVAMAAPLPGERHRPCELVTAPITHDHEQRLESLLSIARELGFIVPAEGAVHLHFDASALCSTETFAKVVEWLHHHRLLLRKLCRTNPACRRLNPWPKSLLDVVRADDFRTLSWEDAQARLVETKPSKYCDFNLRNWIFGLHNKNTFEVRILPVSLHAAPIIEVAQLFQALLDAATKPEAFPLPTLDPEADGALEQFLAPLTLSEQERTQWITQHTSSDLDTPKM